MDQQSRAYIAGKYKNPVSGLACCGETRIQWGDAQEDVSEPAASGEVMQQAGAGVPPARPPAASVYPAIWTTS